MLRGATENNERRKQRVFLFAGVFERDGEGERWGQSEGRAVLFCSSLGGTWHELAVLQLLNAGQLSHHFQQRLGINAAFETVENVTQQASAECMQENIFCLCVPFNMVMI